MFVSYRIMILNLISLPKQPSTHVPDLEVISASGKELLKILDKLKTSYI